MKNCINCEKPYKPLTNGLCKTCYVYQRRTGKPRPYREDGRKFGVLRGEEHPAWKGGDARAETKRKRAQKRYALGECEKCGEVATERHHKDSDPGNNEPDNIMILCRSCHMVIDGRMQEFMSHRNGQEIKPPKPCTNCGRMSKPLRKGLCHTCNEYQRRQGKPRPYLEDGRQEKFNNT